MVTQDDNQYCFTFMLTEYVQTSSFQALLLKQMLPKLKWGLAELLLGLSWSISQSSLGQKHCSQESLLLSICWHSLAFATSPSSFSQAVLEEVRCCQRRSAAGLPISNVILVATSEMATVCGWYSLSTSCLKRNWALSSDLFQTNPRSGDSVTWCSL